MRTQVEKHIHFVEIFIAGITLRAIYTGCGIEKNNPLRKIQFLGNHVI